MSIKYKAESNQKHIDEIDPVEMPISVDLILDKLLYSYYNYIIKDIFSTISELNRYMHEFVVDIGIFNDKQINDIFYSLLFDDNLSFFYDNIIRTLKVLILTPEFDISPFEENQFFQRVLFDITTNLRHPSEGIILLASILDVSRTPRSNFLDPDIIKYLCELSFTSNESIKSAAFSFFASALIIFDDSLREYIDEITALFYNVLLEKINMAKLFYDYLETLLQRIPQEFVSQRLIDNLDFVPLLDYCKNSDKIDQVATLQIVLKLLDIENQNIRNQIDFKYFAYIFMNDDKCENEEEEEEAEIGDDDGMINSCELDKLITILFFKVSSKIIKNMFVKSSFNNYVDSIIQFSVNTIEQSDFKVKKASFDFLNRLIPLSPTVIDKLIEMDYISLLSQYLDCAGSKIKSVIILSFLYILHTITQINEEEVYMMLEEEEIARRINELEINEKNTKVESGDIDIKSMIQEFNILYDELAVRIQYYSAE